MVALILAFVVMLPLIYLFSYLQTRSLLRKLKEIQEAEKW